MKTCVRTCVSRGSAEENNDQWTALLIDERSLTLIGMILQIWLAPKGHSNLNRLLVEDSTATSMGDLIKLVHIKASDVLVGGQLGSITYEPSFCPMGTWK